MMNKINIFIIILIIFFIFFLINNYLTNDEYPPFPIDVVYTWKGEEVTNDIRTSYNNELQYSLRSIDLYAPWINKIYILMNNKNPPSWIKENDKIIIFEHTDTFPNPSYLPNTNSNAIETTIVNIPGLSEHYIYFNDDVFLGNNVKYTDFFTYDGKAIVDKYVLETSSILIDENNNINNIKYPTSNGRMYKHIPIPQIKSIVMEFNEEYSDYIHWVRMTKNRNNKGFDVCESNSLNTPCQQIHYPICKYMYAKNRAIITDNDDLNKVIYVATKQYNLENRLNTIVVTKPKFFCINDNQNNVSEREETRNTVLHFFEVYFPNKPSFEK